jgi:hypothetical protein
MGRVRVRVCVSLSLSSLLFPCRRKMAIAMCRDIHGASPKWVGKKGGNFWGSDSKGRKLGSYYYYYYYVHIFIFNKKNS